MLEMKGRRAGIYKRASKDAAAGTALEGMSVDSQEEEARIVAEQSGWTVVTTYDDNNISASKFAAKERKDWARMLGDIESGHLDVLILWESSRGSRKLSEWSSFLDLIEEHGVLLHVVSHERTYNPKNHRDWETLATDGVKSASYSNLLSSNIKRGKVSARRHGRPNNHPPFGWQRTYDPGSGKMVSQEPVPDEIAIVTSVYERLLSGESLMSVTRDLARRADLPKSDPQWVPRTRRGNRWQSGSVKYMLLNPVYIGKLRDGSGQLLDGNWEGVIPEDLWWGVHRILTAPERKGTRPGKRKYLLTRLARCGVCGCYMSSDSSNKRAPRLECGGRNEDSSPNVKYGCTSIRMSWADDYVLESLAKRLCNSALVDAICRQDDSEQREDRAKAAAISADIESMRQLLHDRLIPPQEYAEYVAKWQPEADRLSEAATQGMSAGAALAFDIRAMADSSGAEGSDLEALMLEAIRSTPLPGQRELVRTFFTNIRIMKGFNATHRFSPDRVALD
jgi:site-specific DNA recombinase